MREYLLILAIFTFSFPVPSQAEALFAGKEDEDIINPQESSSLLSIFGGQTAPVKPARWGKLKSLEEYGLGQQVTPEPTPDPASQNAIKAYHESKSPFSDEDRFGIVAESLNP